MSKIFEALERAREGARAPEDLPELEYRPDRRPVAPPQVEVKARADLDMEAEMLQLHHTLEGLLGGMTGKVIEFIGSREGEGVSTISRQFARACSARLGTRVLLLTHAVPRDAGKRPPSQPWDLPADDDGRVLVRAIPDGRGGDAGGGDPWEAFSAEFDLVVIDAPPAHVSSLGVSVSGKADGTLLVVEADRTRTPIAETVTRRIAESGGKVVGVVLNRRRYHIPDFIYRQL